MTPVINLTCGVCDTTHSISGDHVRREHFFYFEHENHVYTVFIVNDRLIQKIYDNMKVVHFKGELHKIMSAVKIAEQCDHCDKIDRYSLSLNRMEDFIREEDDFVITGLKFTHKNHIRILIIDVYGVYLTSIYADKEVSLKQVGGQK